MRINPLFQDQAANIIRDLLSNNAVNIRQTVFDCYDDKRIIMFQLISVANQREVCILQQIIYTNGNREANIFFDANKQNWDGIVVQNLLNTVFDKYANVNK